MTSLLGALTPLRRCQRPSYRGGLVLDDEHVSAHGRLGLASSLLPFLNGPYLQAVTYRKLFARESLRSANCANVYVWYNAHRDVPTAPSA
jgi:hypothetical protein